MRRSLTVVLPTVAALLTAAALPAAAGAAPATLPTEAPAAALTSLQVSPDAVSVSGLEHRTVTVTAAMTIPANACFTSDSSPGRTRFTDALTARLSRVTPTADPVDTYPDIALTRISGTDASGVWQGSFEAVATMAGQWRVSAIYPCVNGRDGRGLDPVATGFDRRVTVAGSLAPSLAVSVSPGVWAMPGRPGREPTAIPRVLDASGLPVPGVTVAPARWEFCLDASFSGGTATNAAGFAPRWTFNGEIQCITGRVGTAVFFWRQLPYRYWFPLVSAAPSTTSVKVGRTFVVRGIAYPRSAVSRATWPGWIVATVYRQLSPSTWRAIASGRVRSASGRFDVVVPVRARGRAAYQVVVSVVPPNTTALIPTPGRPFVVRGYR